MGSALDQYKNTTTKNMCFAASEGRLNTFGRTGDLFCRLKKAIACLETPFWILLVLAMVIRLAWLAWTNFTFEDAFITFRYARELFLGNGFVYNPGEQIYGTTTPLLTLLLAGWLFITGPDHIIAGARLLDLLGVAIGYLFLWLALRRAGFSVIQRSLALGLLVISSKFWSMDSGGMETPLVILLMAASWYLWAAHRPSLAGLFCGLLLWVRVDLFLWPLILVGFELTSNFKNAWRIALICGLVYLPWFIFAWVYFGSPIPFTATAKWVAYVKFDTQPYQAHLATIFKYLSPFEFPSQFDQFPTILLVPCVLTTLLAIWQVFRARSNRILLPLAAFAVLDIAQLTFTKATFFDRYFIPSLWAVLILAGLAIGSLWDELKHARLGRFLYAGFLMIVMLLGLGFGLISASNTRTTQFYRQDGALKEMGLWLKQHTPIGARVLLEPLGYVGYYSDRNMLDVVGLVTPTVVMLKQAGISDVYQYLKVLRPTDVVVHCDDSLTWQAIKDPTGNYFTKNYRLSAAFNPLFYSPNKPAGTVFYSNLSRNSCYEIWELTP
ncbi:MAG: hypothetical protein P4L50_05095 [Anaerolineaceae bacterium]|nr:hypothetical protein [Anaerolineaceae bacterium]